MTLLHSTGMGERFDANYLQSFFRLVINSALINLTLFWWLHSSNHKAFKAGLMTESSVMYLCTTLYKRLKIKMILNF